MNLDEFKKTILKGEDAGELVLKDISFQVGKVLEEARAIKGLTQSQLAKIVQTSQPVIARIENGNKLPSLIFLKRIADAFNTYLVPPKFGFLEENRLLTVNTSPNAQVIADETKGYWGSNPVQSPGVFMEGTSSRGGVILRDN